MTGQGKVRVNLNPSPDAYGFRYGTAEMPDGETYRLNIMPPKGHWQGDAELAGYEPHDTDWGVYVDGDEVARVRSREDLDDVLTRRLPGLLAGTVDR